jgi:hypothetical protein
VNNRAGQEKAQCFQGFFHGLPGNRKEKVFHEKQEKGKFSSHLAHPI